MSFDKVLELDNKLRFLCIYDLSRGLTSMPIEEDLVQEEFVKHKKNINRGEYDLAWLEAQIAVKWGQPVVSSSTPQLPPNRVSQGDSVPPPAFPKDGLIHFLQNGSGLLETLARVCAGHSQGLQLSLRMPRSERDSSRWVILGVIGFVFVTRMYVKLATYFLRRVEKMFAVMKRKEGRNE